VPEVTSIQRAGTFWTFERPIDEVWNACLDILTQYESILAIDGEGPARSAIAVSGREMPIGPVGGLRTNSGMTFTKFLDVWLAVTVQSEPEDGATTVSMAWISPETGRVASLGTREGLLVPNAELTRTSGDHRRLADPTGFDEIERHLARARVIITHRLADEDKPKGRRPLIPIDVIDTFYYQLATHLYGPERWSRKFVLDIEGAGASPGPAPYERSNKDWREFDKLERETGNWASAKLRRSFVEIPIPMLRENLHDMSNRLLKAARTKADQVEVYVLISPEINAFALPNGDIFIFSGLLENLDTLGQVAAVVAHELDHVLSHDTTQRLVKMRRAQNVATTIMTIGAIAGAGVGAVLAAPAAAATSAAASASANLTSNLVIQGVSLAATTIGQVSGNMMVNGHSKEAELRADSNGAAYLWAAGYDPYAEVELLQKLSELRAQATERNELISSGFINADPGLGKRLFKMRARLKTLPGNVAAEE